jgi:hypothetical protein
MLSTITHVHIPYAALAIVTALSLGSALAQDVWFAKLGNLGHWWVHYASSYRHANEASAV